MIVEAITRLSLILLIAQQITPAAFIIVFSTAQQPANDNSGTLKVAFASSADLLGFCEEQQTPLPRLDPLTLIRPDQAGG